MAKDTAGDNATCPFCDSDSTRLEQRKGTAICRSVYYCMECNEPFEKMH